MTITLFTVLASISLTMAAGAIEPSFAGASTTENQKSEKGQRSMKKIVFLNASKNKNGNTAALARQTLKGLDFKSVNLAEYKIDQIGQETKQDQYKKVLQEISHSDILIIGTPVYWSDMTGYLKTFIDRLADIVDEPLQAEDAPLKGTDVYLIVQGTEPSDAIPGITTVIKHICKRFFMNYKGVVLNSDDAKAINKKIR